MTLLYYDNNSCGFYDELPLDNGTIESCNYCTIGYNESVAECISGQTTSEHTFSYLNYGTCCAVTGIPSDCTLPANYTTFCIGIHSSSDIPSVVVDGIVTLGTEFIKYAPIIAIITLVILAGGYVGIKVF